MIEECENIDFDKLTYKINGYAMKVHRTLGNAFQELIYQRCLAVELGAMGRDYLSEQEQIIYYNGLEVGTKRAVL